MKSNSVVKKDYEHSKLDINRFGFWTYIMTDCILFAALFATYAVLNNNTASGPSAHHLFSLPFVLIETLILLTSSFTIGLAMISVRAKNLKQSIHWLIATLTLGAAFLGMEFYEFAHLINDGYTWRTSAFLSSYFTLIATHGIHIMIGMLWIIIMVSRLKKRGINPKNTNNLAMLSVFWHFLDIIWIFIFSFVYLVGVNT